MGWKSVVKYTIFLILSLVKISLSDRIKFAPVAGVQLLSSLASITIIKQWSREVVLLIVFFAGEVKGWTISRTIHRQEDLKDRHEKESELCGSLCILLNFSSPK